LVWFSEEKCVELLSITAGQFALSLAFDFPEMISPATIDEVKNRMDIVDVISDFVSLKKSGQNYKALSPFTNEKTPSFFVVPAKGIFKDFSSGKGGDAITFVMEHEGMSYAEAIRFLAKKYGVAIQEEQAETSQESQERDALYILMNFAKDYYRDNLLKTEEGRSVGLTYFRERGFNDRTLEKFELGYALEGWEHFSTEAIQKGYNRELLEKAGLVVKKEDGSAYDRFRGRVIFPVHSISGKVIAFGARMLGKDKNQPKYINSPETEIYHKSNVLYGLYQAKNSIRQHDNCYLVEGYTDVISMHQSDVDNVVASSGTALTVDQVKLIRRFTENITVLYDGDTAGIKAAIRGIDIVLKEGLNVYVLLFPDGEDPDSYSRKVGSTAFSEFLTRKKGFISFIIDSFPDQVKNDPIKKSEALISILESLALIPDEKKRAPYYDEIARKLNVPINVVISETNKIRLKAEYSVRNRETQVILPEVIAKSEEPIIKVDPAGMVYYQERETIRLLLNYADQALEDNKVASFLVQELEDVEFTNEVFRDIYGRFKEGVERGDRVDSQYFLQQGSAEIKKAVTDLLTSRYEVSPHWRDKYKIYFPGEADNLGSLTLTNVLRLKFRFVQKMMDSNLQEIKKAEEKGNWDELDEALQTQEGLKKAERELASALGIVVAR